jgi:hypothetical protein
MEVRELKPDEKIVDLVWTHHAQYIILVARGGSVSRAAVYGLVFNAFPSVR